MMSRNIWVVFYTFTKYLMSIICLDVPARQIKENLQIRCLVAVLVRLLPKPLELVRGGKQDSARFSDSQFGSFPLICCR